MENFIKIAQKGYSRKIINVQTDILLYNTQMNYCFA